MKPSESPGCPGHRPDGAYIPPTRLALGAMGGRKADEGGPEKAIAWNDEDTLTLAVAAGRSCLLGFDRSRVDALIFASTTSPFQEKQAAALIARALDLPRDVRGTDLGGTLRAGTTAIAIAADAVKAGSSRNVLVIASDCRMGAPGSALEANLGDGAAAFLISDEDVLAEIEGHHSISDEIVDVWRSGGDVFSHSWEDRFVIQEGYTPRIREAVDAMLNKLEISPDEIARYALYAPDKRSHAQVSRALGLDPEKVQDPLFGRLGNTGVAFAPMQLAAALEDAEPGERIVVASYGDGAETLSLKVTPGAAAFAPPRGLSWHLARRRSVEQYDHYLQARGLTPREWSPAEGPGLSATIHFRERDDDISFRGQSCKACGALQFPAQRVCESCFARDAFEPECLSDRIGRVVTYTFDYFFPSPDPPTVVCVVDIGGARVHLQVTDCPPEDVKIGMEVEFSFRRIHEAGGRPNYFWKGIPRG